MGGTIPSYDKSKSDASAVLEFDVKARLLLGVLIVLQFVALVAFIQFSGRELPDSQLILGAEIAFVTQILNYWFGSSSGSQVKGAKESPASAPQALAPPTP